MIAVLVTAAVVLLASPARGLDGTRWTGTLKRTEKWVLEFQGERLRAKNLLEDAGVLLEGGPGHFLASPVAASTLAGRMVDGPGRSWIVSAPYIDPELSIFSTWVAGTVGGTLGGNFQGSTVELRGRLRPNGKGTKLKVDVVLGFQGYLTEVMPGPVSGTIRLKGTLVPEAVE